MRILYIHQYFAPPDGVGGTRSLEMSRRWVAAGHEVTVITSDAKFSPAYGLGRGVNRLSIDGIDLRVVRVPYSNRMRYARRLSAFAAFAWKSFLAILRCERPDVIFATSTPLTVAVPALLAKLRFRAPMVFEVRDLWPAIPIAIGSLQNPLLIALARALEQAAYRGSERVVALSPGMADGVARTGYARERISVVPNACDLSLGDGPADSERFLAEHPYLRGGPVVTYAGTLGLANGVGYLVEVAAATLALDPAVRFLIAGDGRERERVTDQAHQLDVLGRNLWIIDPVPKSSVAEVLAVTTLATSLLIDTELLRDSSPNKFFDALAAGLPIAINYEGWLADLVQQTGAGLLLPPGRPREAAAELARYVRDGPGLQAASTVARRLATERFDRDKLSSELLEVLGAAAERRLPSPRLGRSRPVVAR